MVNKELELEFEELFKIKTELNCNTFIKCKINTMWVESCGRNHLTREWWDF